MAVLSRKTFLVNLHLGKIFRLALVEKGGPCASEINPDFCKFEFCRAMKSEPEKIDTIADFDAAESWPLLSVAKNYRIIGNKLDANLGNGKIHRAMKSDFLKIGNLFHVWWR